MVRVTWFICCVMLSRASLALGFSFGECPKVNVQENFQIHSYSGKWYEYARSRVLNELGARCVVAEYYNYGHENNSLAVNNRMETFFTRFGISSDSSSILTSYSGDGRLKVSHASNLFPSYYWVLSTDYYNYSVVWSCHSFGIVNTHNIWILTRERWPSTQVVDTAYRVLDANKLDRGAVSVTDQNGCNN